MKASVDPETADDFLDFIDKKCFAGHLRYKDAFGKGVENPLPVQNKMEELLRIALQRRTSSLKAQRHNSGKPLDEKTHIIAETDMNLMYEEWERDVRSWMRAEKRKRHEKYLRAGQKKLAERLRKKFFKIYAFNVSGCRDLLHMLIKHPILNQCQRPECESSTRSAEQPARLTELLRELISNTRSDDRCQKRKLIADDRNDTEADELRVQPAEQPELDQSGDADTEDNKHAAEQPQPKRMPKKRSLKHSSYRSSSAGQPAGRWSSSMAGHQGAVRAPQNAKQYRR